VVVSSVTALHRFGDLGPLGLVSLEALPNQRQEHLVLVGGNRPSPGGDHAGLLELSAAQHQHGGVNRPSSRIMLAGSLGQVSIFSAAHQYSSRVSPFHAKIGHALGLFRCFRADRRPWPPRAWSWVEKMLHDAHRTSAPSANKSLDQHTAVCTVMCSEPEDGARPLERQHLGETRGRSDISPGISCSASRISLRPNSARDRFGYLENRFPLRTSAVSRCSVVVMWIPSSTRARVEIT